MYKCRECGCVFEEPHCWVERHGFTDGLYEEWAACPSCRSCDYDDEGIVGREIADLADEEEDE